MLSFLPSFAPFPLVPTTLTRCYAAGVRFFQILTQIVEMNQKTHLRSFSHDAFSVARILGPKTTTFGHGKLGLGGKIYT